MAANNKAGACVSIKSSVVNDGMKTMKRDWVEMGHYCRICGRDRANEKFSGKGHKIHICKDCMRLPKEERQFIEEEQEICGFLSQANISKKNLTRLKTLTASPNSEIAAMAKFVLEIGKVHPQKSKRLG